MENLSDRELLERNYYANQMLFEMILAVKEDLSASRNKVVAGIYASMINRPDPKEIFEKRLNEYIDKNKPPQE